MMLILNKNYFTYAGFLDSLKMPDSKDITKIVFGASFMYGVRKIVVMFLQNFPLSCRTNIMNEENKTFIPY